MYDVTFHVQVLSVILWTMLIVDREVVSVGTAVSIVVARILSGVHVHFFVKKKLTTFF